MRAYRSNGGFQEIIDWSEGRITTDKLNQRYNAVELSADPFRDIIEFSEGAITLDEFEVKSQHITQAIEARRRSQETDQA